MERMTLSEYELRFKAYQLQRADILHNYATLSIMIRQANYSDNNEYKYNKAEDLINIEKIEQEIFKEPIIDDEAYNKLLRVRR